MRTVTIERKPGFYGRYRALHLFIDGEYVGKIRSGETMSIQIPENARELYGKMDWGKTRPFSLQRIEDGARLIVRSWFTLDLFALFGLAHLPICIERAGQG